LELQKERLFTRDNVLMGWIFEDTITKEECDSLIEYVTSRNLLEKSTVLGEKIEGYRTSSSCFLIYNEHPVANKISSFISNIVFEPMEKFESMQVVHYNSGECYKEHHDYFYDTKEEKAEIEQSGQRTWTGFIYLNDVSEGGCTEFVNIAKTICPKAGRMIIWKNMDDNKTIEDSKHRALPPINCEKWGCNVWVREREIG